jgi:hypothetical protein
MSVASRAARVAASATRRKDAPGQDSESLPQRMRAGRWPRPELLGFDGGLVGPRPPGDLDVLDRYSFGEHLGDVGGPVGTLDGEVCCSGLASHLFKGPLSPSCGSRCVVLVERSAPSFQLDLVPDGVLDVERFLKRILEADRYLFRGLARSLNSVGAERHPHSQPFVLQLSDDLCR